MIRTIKCWAVYRPEKRVIVSGFRTKKDLKAYYSGYLLPIGTVLVQMKGTYAEGMIRRKRK